MEHTLVIAAQICPHDAAPPLALQARFRRPYDDSEPDAAGHRATGQRIAPTRQAWSCAVWPNAARNEPPGRTSLPGGAC
jgi:hypothetical protein